MNDVANRQVFQAPIPVHFADLVDYLRYSVPFARIVHDRSVERYLPMLNGKVLELGAGAHDYSSLATGVTDYVRSNYTPDASRGIVEIDATKLPHESNSLDGVVCLNTLEHIEDYASVICEVERVLKPDGIFLLSVPWLFPFHGAPDDYHRFSSSALLSHLKEFDIEVLEAVGNFWISQAMFLQRPVWSRPRASKKTRFYDPFLRLLGLIMILAGRNSDLPDDNHALLYTCLCRKTLHAH